MPDRVDDIREHARTLWPDGSMPPRDVRQLVCDVGWLLDEVDTLRRRLDFETRLAADLETQLDRAHERHAAEIERLRGYRCTSEGCRTVRYD